MLQLSAIALAVVYALLAATMVFAQGAPTEATIPLSPLVAELKPYVDLLVTSVVGAVITWLAVLISKYTGIKNQATLVEQIKSAAQTEAGAAIARAEDNLAGRSVNVGSPMVAQAVSNIQGRIPGILDAAGATPESLSAIVVGEIGKLQAATGSSATAVAVTPDAGKASQATGAGIVETHVGGDGLMDILAALDVAGAVASKQDFGTTVADLRMLWGIYNGGKPDVLGIVKSGKMVQVLDALSRTVAVLDVVAKDPAHSQSVISLLESLAPAGA